MMELFGLFLLGAAIFVGIALVVGVLKLAFKLLILPFSLAGALFKGVVALLVLPLFLVIFVPLAITVGAVVVPLLIVGFVLALIAFACCAVCGLVGVCT